MEVDTLTELDVFTILSSHDKYSDSTQLTLSAQPVSLS